MIRKVLLASAALAVTFSAVTARAQQTPLTPMQKQIERIDFSVQGVGMFTKEVSGPVIPVATNTGQTVTNTPSNTVGAVFGLRYTSKPWVGAEFNYGYARYTQNYSNAGGVQTRANELTLGYVVTPAHQFFGLQPYASVGAGTTAFKPTPHGGQGLSTQYRATYYYTVGVQNEYFSHIGFRAGFRQLFFLAPDYGQNYLTIKKRTITSEPSIGFYLRF